MVVENDVLGIVQVSCGISGSPVLQLREGELSRGGKRLKGNDKSFTVSMTASGGRGQHRR